jgi:hypothetical protein
MPIDDNASAIIAPLMPRPTTTTSQRASRRSCSPGTIGARWCIHTACRCGDRRCVSKLVMLPLSAA